ncbi:hypothetical protein DU500_16250 [Haloplanus rubicundus]|uniref:Uncharacterized protein n=1 Tax=Haloplanus rubicundus TaxID=1547898 RepID=A0A345EGE6_9EURY|nr:hypothetical protein DU500_16250 [Haloplanus rubicundus]AXG11268.1 hypothetical protein DU484_16210 [Haloplanus rubicundus]
MVSAGARLTSFRGHGRFVADCNRSWAGCPREPRSLAARGTSDPSLLPAASLTTRPAHPGTRPRGPRRTAGACPRPACGRRRQSGRDRWRVRTRPSRPSRGWRSGRPRASSRRGRRPRGWRGRWRRGGGCR